MEILWVMLSMCLSIIKDPFSFCMQAKLCTKCVRQGKYFQTTCCIQRAIYVTKENAIYGYFEEKEIEGISWFNFMTQKLTLNTLTGIYFMAMHVGLVFLPRGLVYCCQAPWSLTILLFESHTNPHSFFTQS